jgi:hypothetical protein
VAVVVVPLDGQWQCGHFDTKHGCGWAMVVAVAVGLVFVWQWLFDSIFFFDF